MGLIADLFAGGGGASLGIEMALGRSPDIAINHDAEAIAMHSTNHPTTTHLLGDVWNVDPVAACRGRSVEAAWFSPDCCHFSRCKNGKPLSRKRRALAWVVIRWARAVRPAVIFCENVVEWLDWGPLDANDRPDQLRKGLTFRVWLGKLKAAGYVVEMRELRACDYGAPTIRKRLFVIARCDGAPIVWPTPTHGAGLLPYRTAAECVDWKLPIASIFERRRPLVTATLARIAKGVERFVLCPNPYIVNDFIPSLVQTGYGERKGQTPRALDIRQPLGTVVAGGAKHALVAAFLAKHYGGHSTPGSSLTAPMSTVTTQDHHALVAATLHESKQSQAAAMLARFGVHAPQIEDIAMRMLSPRELFSAQDFPRSYVIDPVVNGKPLSQTAQIRMAGNSVSPAVAAAIVAANVARKARAA